MTADEIRMQRELDRLQFARELAISLLEGDGEELHLKGYHHGRRLPAAGPLTSVQRARLAAMVLNRGGRAR